MKTALYIRVSTTEQAKEGYSLAAQKHKLVNYCDLKGWNIVEIYSDEGISGSSLKERPQAMRMLEDAKKRLFDNILILKVDRLCRNTKDLLDIIDLLKKYNVRLNAVDEQIDYTTPVGKMMLTMLGSFAELERSTISERMKLGKEQKVRIGIKSKTGKILYGYQYIDGNYIINEEEAAIVRLVFQKLINGESLRSIVRYLLENKIANPDRKWTATIIKRMIMNPTYKGYTFSSLYKHPHKYIDFENAIIEPAKNVEPIVSEEIYEQANIILRARTNGNVRKYAKSDFYFADVVYCYNCGWKLASKCAKNHYSPERRKYYRCYYNQINIDDPKCNFTSIENGVLEELFLKHLENLEINFDEAEETVSESIDENKTLLENLYQSRDKIRQRKDKLLEKLLDGMIEDEQFTSTSAMLSDELISIERQINELESKVKTVQKKNESFKNFKMFLVSSGMTIRNFWNNLDNNQKRTFVSTLVKKIYVSRSKIELIEFN